MPGQPKTDGGTLAVGPWKGGSRTKPLFGVGSCSAQPGHGERVAAGSPQHPLVWGPALHRRLGALLALSLPGKRVLWPCLPTPG